MPRLLHHISVRYPGRSSCFSKPQVDNLLQNCLVAKVLKVYSLRLQSTPH